MLLGKKMSITIREYTQADLPAITEIWNDIVKEGNAFPQCEPLTKTEAEQFFASQSFTGVAEIDGETAGMYILHPNNTGRCGHICNASFGVAEKARGKKVGEMLVRHCLKTAPEFGFRILQFNAVVSTNTAAVRLYEKLGFSYLGTVPGGFRADSGYKDINLYYKGL